MTYKKLLEVAHLLDLKVIDNYDLKLPDLKGLINGRNIFLSEHLKTSVQKKCVLAEEIAHYLTNTGNITDLTDVNNRRQEFKAHKRACKNVIPLTDIIDAAIVLKNEASMYNLAEYLGVTEKFLNEAIYFYSLKNEPEIFYKNYIVTFNPFRVLKENEVAE